MVYFFSIFGVENRQNTNPNLLNYGIIIVTIILFIVSIPIYRWHVRYQERRTTRKNFLSAFVPIRVEIEAITYKNSIFDIDKILNKHHSDIRGAMIAFNDSLSDKKRRDLKSLWFKYCDEDKEGVNKPIRYLHHSFKSPGHNKTTIEMRDAVLQCINKLLELANHD